MATKDRITILREFGLVMSAAAAVIGGILQWYNNPAVLWALVVSALFLAAAICFPTLLGPLEVVWMKLAEKIGNVVTFLIMTILFWVAFVPTGLILRVMRKDLLLRKLDPEASSYWIAVDPEGPCSRAHVPY